MLHEFACHPCAGPMLKFSIVPVLVYVLPKPFNLTARQSIFLHKVLEHQAVCLSYRSVNVIFIEGSNSLHIQFIHLCKSKIVSTIRSLTLENSNRKKTGQFYTSDAIRPRYQLYQSISRQALSFIKAIRGRHFSWDVYRLARKSKALHLN